jgi:hypothetical protein
MEALKMSNLLNMTPEARVGLLGSGAFQGTDERGVPGPTIEGIEPTISFKAIMAVYGWKYHKVYRYFIGHPSLGVKFTFNPGKRPKRVYDVPVSVVKAEWIMMHSVNKDKADEWDRLHPYQKRPKPTTTRSV